jgi:D-3-phosphoglycerate dehydrogenase
LEVCVEGDIAGYDTRILELAVLKGFFGSISEDPVSYVNAPQLASDHGLEVREVNCATSPDYVNLLTVNGNGHSISGTLSGPKASQRVVNIDGVPFDVPPVDHMVVITNDDRPGVIGSVGTILGEAGVNIADMDVSRVIDSDSAVMLIAPTKPVSAEVLDTLRSAPGILSVTPLSA